LLFREEIRPMRLTKIRQSFDRPRLADATATTREQLARFRPMVKPGMSIAIAAGSRGIPGIAAIVRHVVEFVKSCGAMPFIVPAMGSHGGATADGQQRILADYGITEAAMGAPVRSSMDTVELPRGDSPLRLFMDKLAYGADGTILVNRVKPHTDFHGPYESGLVKMTTIGLGKQDQAFEVHRYGVAGLRDLMPLAAQKILASGKIIGGLAIVENAYDETMVIRSLLAGEIMAEEPKLLQTARDNMARLPVNSLDVLIVDFMGKDICGVGIDPNIIGRTYIHGQEEPATPRINAIVITDLTPASHGNALGIGFADVTTRRLFDKIDYHALYENVSTATFLERAKIPLMAENDREAVDLALSSCGVIAPGKERIIRIRDSLHLEELYASEAVVRELDGSGRAQVGKETVEMFDVAGNLARF
jgi:hypothetical protein